MMADPILRSSATGSARSNRSAEDITAEYVALRRSSSRSAIDMNAAQLEPASSELPVEHTGKFSSRGRSRSGLGQSRSVPDMNPPVGDLLHGAGPLSAEQMKAARYSGRPPRVEGGARHPTGAHVQSWQQRGGPPRYTPGPGAYHRVQGVGSVSYTRKGVQKGPSFTAGGSDRSFVKAAIDQSCSPGPKYRLDHAPLLAAPGYSFGCDYKYLKAPHNSPATVPGPGKYVADKTRFGVRIFSKHTDSPAFRFGKEQYTNACDGPTKVKYESVGHEIEFQGVHSPGPIYNTRSMDKFKFHTNGNFTLPEKISHHNDSLEQFQRTPGPGTYQPRACRDGGGQMSLNAPFISFIKAPQRTRADINLSATPFVSEVHSRIENTGADIPSPTKYNPQLLPKHIPTPSMHGYGSADRFRDEFEAGRIR